MLPNQIWIVHLLVQNLFTVTTTMKTRIEEGVRDHITQQCFYAKIQSSPNREQEQKLRNTQLSFDIEIPKARTETLRSATGKKISYVKTVKPHERIKKRRKKRKIEKRISLLGS